MKTRKQKLTEWLSSFGFESNGYFYDNKDAKDHAEELLQIFGLPGEDIIEISPEEDSLVGETGPVKKRKKIKK